MVFCHNNINPNYTDNGTREYSIDCDNHDHVLWEKYGRPMEFRAGKATDHSDLNELFCRSLEKNVERYVEN